MSAFEWFVVGAAALCVTERASGMVGNAQVLGGRALYIVCGALLIFWSATAISAPVFALVTLLLGAAR